MATRRRRLRKRTVKRRRDRGRRNPAHDSFQVILIRTYRTRSPVISDTYGPLRISRAGAYAAARTFLELQKVADMSILMHSGDGPLGGWRRPSGGDVYPLTTTDAIELIEATAPFRK
jgi:hypothetical protein